jgi:hypothetical protein
MCSQFWIFSRNAKKHTFFCWLLSHSVSSFTPVYLFLGFLISFVLSICWKSLPSLINYLGNVHQSVFSVLSGTALKHMSISLFEITRPTTSWLVFNTSSGYIMLDKMINCARRSPYHFTNLYRLKSWVKKCENLFCITASEFPYLFVPSQFSAF